MTIEIIGPEQADARFEVQCESCVVRGDSPKGPSYSPRIIGSRPNLQLPEAIVIGTTHEVEKGMDHQIKIFNMDSLQQIQDL